MYPDNIGILSLIEDAHKYPEKYALVLARRTARLIIQELQKKEKLSPLSLSGADRLLLSSLRQIQTAQTQGEKQTLYWHALAESLKDMIVAFIRDHKEGGGRRVSQEQELVAHAALHLIANTLERKGQHTLAHFIENHTTSHPESADKNHTFSLQLLFDKDRLALLDRGIVNANPLSGTIYSAGSEEPPVRSRLWEGYDLPETYDPKTPVEEKNILVEIDAEKSIHQVLKGDRLFRKHDYIVTVNSEKSATPEIEFYTEPSLQEGATSGFKTTKKYTLKDDIGGFKSIRGTKVPYSPWTFFEVIGSKKTITVCINANNTEKIADAEPGPESGTNISNANDTAEVSDAEPSFQSNNSIHVVQNTYFFIDQDKQELTIFSRSPDIKKESLKISELVAINNNGIYFVDVAGTRKKITFKNGEINTGEIQEDEQALFEK